VSDAATPPPLGSAARPRTAPIAIWSLILGCVSIVPGAFFITLPAIICGHIARSTIRKSGGSLSGRGMATAGLVLGYIALVLNLIFTGAILIPMIRSDMQRRAELASSPQEIAAADGKTRITAPGDWTKLPGLNKVATLQAGNKAQDEFLLVIAESKTDLADLTLQQHHEKTRNATVGRLESGSSSEVSELTIDGHPALQDELRGVSNHTNVVFLHTTVEGKEHFYQILAWTLKSKWAEKKEKLQKISSSFRSE
jgi:hypothetical protein